MVNDDVVIVGLACRYPAANNPAELWENVLNRRLSSSASIILTSMPWLVNQRVHSMNQAKALSRPAWTAPRGRCTTRSGDKYLSIFSQFCWCIHSR
ncbi:MAG: hypothetical protein DIU79_00305 [Actinobacteria bacterium]|nr:MAG: hypothetical protein DIU79_00305 [Actinomycetota bacterium]